MEKSIVSILAQKIKSSVLSLLSLKGMVKVGLILLICVISVGTVSAGTPLIDLHQWLTPASDVAVKDDGDVAKKEPFDRSDFISQYVPSVLDPGEKVQVIIRMKNTGTSTWNREDKFKLGSQSPQDNILWTGGTRVRLSRSDSVKPGQIKEFTFIITAPSEPGTYKFQWRMVKESVHWFGDYSHPTNIRVKTPDDSEFISQDVPSVLQPGQKARVSITMENTGSSTWTRTEGYKLGSQDPQDNKLWTGGTRIYLDSTDAIAPGQRKTFTFEITSPSEPGLYPFQWRMVREGVGWFGRNSRHLSIRVKAPVQNTDDAQFISQSVPASLRPGQQALVSITMKNSGSSTWTRENSYKLGSQKPQDNKTWIGSTRVYLDSGDSIAPGQSKTFHFEIRAPSEPGIYNFQWRMVHENVHWFGDLTQNVEIQVGEGPKETPTPPPGSFQIRPGLWPASSEERSTADLDGDGIPQNLELELAQWFFPTIWFDDGEDCTAPGGSQQLPPRSPGRLVYRVQPHPDGPEMIAITYALLFKRDCGDNGGLTCHAGDVEPFSITLIPQSLCPTGYGIYSIKTWAHEGTIGETKEVKYLRNRCTFGHSANPIGREDIVLSAENKHGNYLRDSTCDSALFWAENCDLDFTAGDENAWVGLNAGERDAQLNNDLGPLGFSGERLWNGAKFCGGLGLKSGCPGAVHTKLDLVAPAPVSIPKASFVTQSVPDQMVAGTSATVSITMRNIGTAKWTRNGGYKLGTQNPPDNTRWIGDIRVLLSQEEIIYPHQEKTFTFTITAPEAPGNYNFQWRMVLEGVQWFGDTTPNMVIHVVPANEPTQKEPSPTPSPVPDFTPTPTPVISPSHTPTSTPEVSPSPTSTPPPAPSPTPTTNPITWELDNFDNLATGALHGQNGWQKIQASARVVASDRGGKLLMIDANPNVTINMAKNAPQQNSGQHRFEFDVMVMGANEASLAKIEVRTHANTGWDKKFQLYFGSSMRVNYSSSGAASTIVPTTQMGHWYHIRCDINLNTAKMDIWVDGAKIESGIPVHPGPIVGLSLSGWDRSGVVYLDNLVGRSN